MGPDFQRGEAHDRGRPYSCFALNHGSLLFYASLGNSPRIGWRHQRISRNPSGSILEREFARIVLRMMKWV